MYNHVVFSSLFICLLTCIDSTDFQEHDMLLFRFFNKTSSKFRSFFFSLFLVIHRYDKVPENMYSPYPELSHITGYRTNTGVYAARANENHMKVLSHYLYHHRWIWAVQDEGCRSPNPDVVARILAVLTR